MLRSDLTVAAVYADTASDLLNFLSLAGLDTSGFQLLLAQALSSMDQCRMLSTKPDAEILDIYKAEHCGTVAADLEKTRAELSRRETSMKSALEGLSSIEVHMASAEARKKALQEELQKVEDDIFQAQQDLRSLNLVVQETPAILGNLQSRVVDLARELEGAEKSCADMIGGEQRLQEIRNDLLQGHMSNFQHFLSIMCDRILP